LLAILPILTFIVVFSLVHSLSERISIRHAFLRAAVLWGAYAILSVELLSLGRMVTKIGLSVAWLLPLAIGSLWLVIRQKGGHPLRFSLEIPSDRIERIYLIVILIIIGITATVAILTPPQTWDSLTYHLSRVAHWAQENAVVPFATGIEVQNSMYPGGEILVLQFYVLAGGDRLANFPEWLAMIGSLVGISFLAQQIGLNRRRQWFAVLVLATLPMGIVQASSTMTDYIVAFWLVCTLVEAAYLAKKDASGLQPIILSLSAGLAIATKPTAIPYLIVIAVFSGYIILKRTGILGTLKWAIVALTAVILLFGGHMYRSYQLYASPFGDPQRVKVHVNEVFSAKPLASNVLRNTSYQMGTPWPKVNYVNHLVIVTLHDWMGFNPTDIRTTAHGQFAVIKLSAQEDLAANPLHTALTFISIVLVLVFLRKHPKAIRWYTLFWSMTFVFYCLVFKFTIFGSRLLLPSLVFAAPLIAAVLGDMLASRMSYILSAGLLVAAVPFLIGIRSRPLIAYSEEAYVESVLVEDRSTLYFANGKHLINPYEELTNQIKTADCGKVGIMITGNQAEYPLWVLMGAPRNDLEMEWIIGERAPSAAYRQSDFNPCAIICERCPEEQTTIRGLPRVESIGEFHLYLSLPD